MFEAFREHRSELIESRESLSHCEIFILSSVNHSTVSYKFHVVPFFFALSRSSDDELKRLQSILEEKENDLLLSASIGKELLEKNSKLEDKVIELQSFAQNATENIEQLNYQLAQKNDLITKLTRDDECGSQNATPTTSKSIDVELMRRKIVSLEEENKTLRAEVHQIVMQSDEIEENERKLMLDLSQQLNDRSLDYESMSIEMERYREENHQQNDEIIELTKRLAEVELRLHQITNENDETSSLLCITKENQDLLAHELAEYKQKYAETLALLHETQEVLRKHLRKSQPSVRGGGAFMPGVNSYFGNDSIQCEMQLDSLDSGILSDSMSATKSFRAVNDAMRFVQNSGKALDEMSQLGSMTMSSSSAAARPLMSSLMASDDQYLSTVYGSSRKIDKFERTQPVYDDELTSKIGVPGVPGAKDLEEALNRLTPGDILSRRAMLSYAPAGTYSYDDQPNCRTPESIYSNFSALSNGTGSTTREWKMPKKLEIVKPMEGSQTLNMWSRLATPTFDGLLQDNERIKVRGEKRLEDLGLQMYSLADVEEDYEEFPGKQFESSNCVYTLTNSTVLHPDDGTTSITFSLPSSQVSSRMTSNVNSRQATAPPTPRILSRRNSCSTFSVSIGLASVLNERGIKAVTPSALNTPSGQNFSPTVTPCNSPTEGNSPTRPLSPEAGPSFNNKKQFIHLEKKALRSLKLLERVENLGLENIVQPSCRISPLALYSSNIYTSRSSPMAQLTSLRNFAEKRNSDENLKAHTASPPDMKSPTDPKKHSNERKMSRSHRQKSRRNLLSGASAAQRRDDLGTVTRQDSISKGTPSMEPGRSEEKSLVEGFVGSISSLLFGRKGGLL